VGIPEFETTRLYAYRVGNDSFYALYVVLAGLKVEISQMVHLSKNSIQGISA